VAHKPTDEKVVYIGDSRVKVKTGPRPLPVDYSAYPGKSEAFVPNFLLKEWMVGAVVLVGFMVLVMTHPAPLGYPADPNNTEFIPMPDWYFLFMYQLLKYPYTSEHFKIMGTLAIPGIAFGSLLLAPFLDRGKERRFYRRPIASSLMIMAIISVFYLTYVSWDHYQHELEAKGITPEHILKEQEILAGAGQEPTPTPAKEATIVARDEEGFDIYQRATCVMCHGDSLNGAVTLLGVGDKHDKDEILGIIKEGYKSMPAQYEANIANGLTEAEIDTLADWLSRQKAE